MSAEIREVAMKWAQAMQSRSPENVLRLYHPDGTLWGTLSPVVRHGNSAILEYFIKFLQWDDLRCEFTDESVIKVYNDFAFYSGSYIFSWTARNKLVKVPARFSFIYKKENGEWFIMEHHSSLFPELPFRIRKYFIKQE